MYVGVQLEKCTLVYGVWKKLEEWGIKMHCLVCNIEAVGTLSHCERILRYLQVPNDNKFIIDFSPLLYRLAIPGKILDARSKALATLPERPATNHQVYQYLSGHPSIGDVEEFSAHIARKIKENKALLGQIPFLKLDAWVSKQGDKAQSQTGAILDRVRSHYLREYSFKAFFDRAGSAACICDVEDELYLALKKSVEWHDAHEYYGPHQGKSVEKIGKWLDCAVKGSFKDRATVLTISGAKGSGKSTILNSFGNFFEPKDAQTGIAFSKSFYFRLKVEDPDWPFHGISRYCMLLNLNDYGTSLKGLAGPSLLNLTERIGSFAFPQKGAPALVTEKIPLLVMSHNGLNPSPLVNKQQLDAFQGRDGSS